MILSDVIRTNPLAKVAAIAAGLLMILLTSVLLSQGAFAADGKNFRPGRIIDDNIFYNANAMTASQIQTFLNGKVPSCDTNGSGIATEFGSNLTRAEYAASRGWQSPPYICLRNFKQNTPQVEAASQLCEGLSAQTNRTAAQIIADVAKACGINPQVLIVLLQKEQSLVTDIWPLNTQYKYATGFACPDTAPCNDSYSGFFNQVYLAAKQYKIYKRYPNNYNYIAGANNTVKWNPLSSCGTSTFYIENQATAALYIYTPYRPNQAALDNMYGTGNSCSSYGNRNFWRWFTDWFGPTTGPLISSSGLLMYGWNTSDPVTAVFDIKNITKSTLNVDYIRVRAFNESGDQYLFWAKDNLTLAPGQRYKYEQSLTIDKEGDYTFVIDRKIGSTWYPVPFSDFNYSGQTTEERTISHKPELIESLELDKSSIHVNEPVTATFDVINNSAIKSVNVGLLKVDGHDANGTQYQFDPTSSNLTLTPGQTYTYSDTRSFDKTGKYTFEVTNNNPNLGWNTSYPQSDNASIIRRLDVNVKTQATITEGLTINQTAREGDTITAAFKLRNFGTTSVNVGSLKVEAYGADGTQYQFEPTASNLTLTPGQEYTYTESRTAPPKGSYTFRIVNQNSTMGWNSTFPMSETSNLVRSAKVNVKYPADITTSLSITPTSATAGTTRTATFKVQNFGTTAVNLGQLKVEAFSASGQHYQFAPTSNLVLAPGQEYTYSATLVLSVRGSYSFRIVHKHPQFGWLISLPPAHDSSVLKTQTITVQ